MMQLTITDAGRAALVNAANTGTLPITLDKVVLGSALYSPVATQTALQAPIKTITSFGADAVADDTIHITITDESADEYDLGEIGIYAGNTLFGIYSQSTPILEKGASQMVLLSADIQFTSVPVNSITVGATSFAYPQATETRMGVMKIATPAKVTEGTDHTSAVTPKTLKQEVSTRLGKTENAASASKWQTPRTVKLSGDATGEVTIDGSENVTLPVSVNDDSHNHSVLASKGNVTAVTGVARGAAGMMMMQSYANGYPEATGNVIHLGGLGQGEIFVGWSASSTTSVGYHAGLYVRSARDTNSLWSDWARVYTTAYKPTAADVGAMADGGSYSTVHMSNWYRSTGPTGWYNETYGGGIYMEDATWIRIGGSKQFFVSNTASDSIRTEGGIATQGGITAQGEILGGHILAQGKGNGYNTLAFESRGDSSSLYPGYGFHQPGVFAGSVQMRTAADFYFLKIDGALANVSANVFNGYLNGCAYAAERLATARYISITGDVTGSATFDGSGNISIPVTIAVSESIQPGMIIATAQNGVPAGFLECNGAAISRTAYAALYARLGTWWGAGDGSTTFNVPDLRGVFIRGLDNGRGLDVGRGFASYQADAFQGHGHFGVNVVGYTGGWGDQNSNIGTARTESAGTTDKGYGTPRIASETRPKNVAMRYCIKY